MLQPNRAMLYGYTNRITHTSLSICLPNAVREQLDLTMLMLAKPLTTSQLHAYQQQNLVLKTQKFAGYFSMKCLTQLVKLKDAMLLHMPTLAINYATQCDEHAMFICPMGHSKLAVQPFDCNNSGKLVWCSECHKAHGGNHWTCRCEFLWHTCPIHFSAPSNHTSKAPQKRSTPQPDSSLQSARKLKKIEPPRRSTPRLGPILAARFPNLRPHHSTTQGALNVDAHSVCQGSTRPRAQTAHQRIN